MTSRAPRPVEEGGEQPRVVLEGRDVGVAGALDLDVDGHARERAEHVAQRGDGEVARPVALRRLAVVGAHAAQRIGLPAAARGPRCDRGRSCKPRPGRAPGGTSGRGQGRCRWSSRPPTSCGSPPADRPRSTRRPAPPCRRRAHRPFERVQRVSGRLVLSPGMRHVQEPPVQPRVPAWVGGRMVVGTGAGRGGGRRAGTDDDRQQQRDEDGHPCGRVPHGAGIGEVTRSCDTEAPIGHVGRTPMATHSGPCGNRRTISRPGRIRPPPRPAVVRPVRTAGATAGWRRRYSPRSPPGSPGVVDQPVSSRHLPDCGLYSDPLDCGYWRNGRPGTARRSLLGRPGEGRDRRDVRRRRDRFRGDRRGRCGCRKSCPCRSCGAPVAARRARRPDRRCARAHSWLSRHHGHGGETLVRPRDLREAASLCPWPSFGTRFNSRRGVRLTPRPGVLFMAAFDEVRHLVETSRQTGGLAARRRSSRCRVFLSRTPGRWTTVRTHTRESGRPR